MNTVRRLYSVFGNREALFEAARYFLASLAALGVDLGVLYALKAGLNVELMYSSLAGFVAGLLFIYAVSIRHVFAFRRMEGSVTVEFSWFWISGVIGALFTMWAMPWLTEGFSLHILVAKIAVSGVVFSFNYFSRKLILFTDWARH